MPATVQAITRLVTDILLAVVDPAPAPADPDDAPELHLYYNRPTTGAAYVAVGQRLLPLDDAWRIELSGVRGRPGCPRNWWAAPPGRCAG